MWNGLILFCFFYQLKREHSLNPLPEKHQKAAQVSFLPKHATALRDPKEQIPREFIPASKKLESRVRPQPRAISTTQNEARSPHQSETQLDNNSLNHSPVKEESTQTPRTPETKGIRSTAAPDITHGQAATSDKPSHVTGADFMNAFRKSVHQDRQQSRPRTKTGSQAGSSGASTLPEHVQAHLDELQFDDYRRKLRRAIIKATRLFKKYVRTPNDLNSQTRCAVTLDKQGKIKNFPLLEKTGIDDIDDAIIELIKSIDFPPLPARLGVEELPFTCQIRLHLPEGGHMLQLEYYDRD